MASQSQGLIMMPHLSSTVRPRERSRSVTMEFVDLFPDPVPVTVGGIEVVAPAKQFPTQLSSPASAARASITPFPDFIDVIFAPAGAPDLLGAVFLGLALQLGPDFLLAPAGLVSDEGIRPGYALESVIGEVLEPEAQWLKDRRERLAADSPLKVKAIVTPLFIAAGLLLDRLLLFALEDPSFVVSTGICACIGAGLLEILREPLPTRAERDLNRKLTDEFLLFANERIDPSGRCHERDIVREFRAFYPRYRCATSIGAACIPPLPCSET